MSRGSIPPVPTNLSNKMTYATLKTWAEKYHCRILATDKRFKNCVQICSVHGGTTLFYRAAFAIKSGEFYMVFTEHEGFALYHQEDYSVRMFKNCRIEEM